MILTSVFRHDDNRWLKYVQHDRYQHNVWRIFDQARRVFVRADAILRAGLRIAEEARAMTSIDHRPLQDAHDMLAATYRYRHDDGGQLELFETPQKQDLRYSLGWERWLGSELERLLEFPVFVRSVVECSVCANTEFGYAAEQALGAFLVTYYGLEDWAFRDGYPATYPALPS
jgi:hypothetical protein